MKVVTTQEMREIDRRTIEEFGIPGQVLMERAGMAVASKIRELFAQKKTIVLVGGGNNGGDGIVVARELFNSGWHVKVLLFAKQNKLSPDCLSQFRSAKQAGVPVEINRLPPLVSDASATPSTVICVERNSAGVWLSVELMVTVKLGWTRAGGCMRSWVTGGVRSLGFGSHTSMSARA